MPSMLCAPLGTRLSSGFPQSSSTERALVLGTISVADNPLGVASLRPVEVLRYRGFRRRVREGGGRTADPSTSLRFGRDDKGESSVSIKHRIVAEHTAGPSTTLGSGRDDTFVLCVEALGGEFGREKGALQIPCI